MKLIYEPKDDKTKPIYMILNGTLTREIVERHPARLFIFPENLERFGKSGIGRIRDCPNTFGLRLKKDDDKKKSSFFYDSDFLWFTTILLEDLSRLEKERLKKEIVFLSSLRYSDCSLMPDNAPRCWMYLINHLNNFTQGEYFG